MNAHELRVEETAAPYLVAPLLTDHFDTFASAPEGFKRLRELVLNLAVRGMLVPQDPKDEPAGKLLKRIRSTSNRAAPLSEDSEPYELPSSWVWATLDETTNVGETIKAGILQDDVWVLDLEDIEKDTSKVARKVRFSERQSKSDKNVFLAGDVLYGKLRPYLNKVIVADEPGVCTTEILPLRGYESIDPSYIKTFLQSPSFIEYVNAKSYGMKMPRLGTADARKAHFALPPLAEQSRIVAKVEELMALIAALEAKVGAGETARGKLLDTLLAALADSPDAAATADAWAQLAPHFDLLLQTPTDVDRLQQTLLQLAVKGRLVPQNPNDQPAAELLKQFVVEEKRKRGKPEDEIASDAAPFELPPGWLWVLVRAVSNVAGGIQKTPARAPKQNHYPYLRVANVQRGRLVLDEIERFELLPGELEKRRLESGDILVVEGNGSEKEIGRCALWRGEIEDCVHQNHLIRIRPLAKEIADFLLLFLNSEYGRAAMKQLAITTSGLFTLSVGKIETIALPLPPLAEQSRIVAAVASLTALCDRLRERLAARRALSAKLATTLTESALQ